MDSNTHMGNSMADLEDEEGLDSDLMIDPKEAEQFECPICAGISRDPIETEPCGMYDRCYFVPSNNTKE